MQLSKVGNIAEQQVIELTKYFPLVKIDYSVVMPNHIHIIIHVGAPLAGARILESSLVGSQPTGSPNNRAGASPTPTLGQIIGGYKSLISTKYLKSLKNHQNLVGNIWQRNYYEHIIRDEDDLCRIREYIDSNVKNWMTDKLNVS